MWLPLHLVHIYSELAPGRPAATSRYAVGMRVEHAKFGRGEITGVEEMAADVKVTVLFESAGRKSLLSRYANLEIID